MIQCQRATELIIRGIDQNNRLEAVGCLETATVNLVK